MPAGEHAVVVNGLVDGEGQVQAQRLDLALAQLTPGFGHHLAQHLHGGDDGQELPGGEELTPEQEAHSSWFVRLVSRGDGLARHQAVDLPLR